MPRLVPLTLLLIAMPCLAAAPPPGPGNVVTYTRDGKEVWEYYLLPNGLVYPGAIRNSEFIVWHDAKPFAVSEYAYGGPTSRIPLIRTSRLPFYRTEPAPKGLMRHVSPRE
jgi:hypothetical protein